MGDQIDEATPERIRATLLEKIQGKENRPLSAAMEELLRLASNDDLQRFLAISQVAASVFAEPLILEERGPTDDSWQIDDEHVVVEKTGAGLPPHTYALAKDTFAKYKGPSWCPVNLWSAFRHGAHGTDPKLTKECAKKLIYSARAADIWRAIADRYDRPDAVALTLPSRCADFLIQWRATPKHTPGEHRKSRLALQVKAEELASELDKFFDRLDAPYFLNLWRGVNFPQLMSEDQREHLDLQLKWHNHQLSNQVLTEANIRRRDWDSGLNVPSHQTWEMLFSHDPRQPGIVPTVQEQLRMVGDFFAQDALAPPIPRPNSENAERNYFARRLIRYFADDHGGVSPTIVANITSIFFAQGITADDVSHMSGMNPPR